MTANTKMKAKALLPLAAFAAALVAGGTFDIKVGRYAAEFYVVMNLLATPLAFRRSTLERMAESGEVLPPWLQLIIAALLLIFMVSVGAYLEATGWLASLLVVRIARLKATAIQESNGERYDH